MSRPRAAAAAFALCLLAAHAAATAADKAFLTQVSELLGIVEAPRYLRDACADRLPDQRRAIEASYEAWRRRHAPVLGEAAAQVQRAEARAKQQGSPFSLADLSEAGAQQMRARLEGVPLPQARTICAGYEDFLKDMDSTMRDTVPGRIRNIEAAAAT